MGPVFWDEALDRVATAFQSTQSPYGKDAVGIFGGGSLTNEKAYLLGKFARVALGTANIDLIGIPPVQRLEESEQLRIIMVLPEASHILLPPNT